MEIKANQRDERKMGSKYIDGITKFLRFIDVCAIASTFPS
jgi:hypothetical protein